MMASDWKQNPRNDMEEKLYEAFKKNYKNIVRTVEVSALIRAGFIQENLFSSDHLKEILANCKSEKEKTFAVLDHLPRTKEVLYTFVNIIKEDYPHVAGPLEQDLDAACAGPSLPPPVPVSESDDNKELVEHCQPDSASDDTEVKVPYTAPCPDGPGIDEPSDLQRMINTQLQRFSATLAQDKKTRKQEIEKIWSQLQKLKVENEEVNQLYEFKKKQLAEASKMIQEWTNISAAHEETRSRQEDIIRRQEDTITRQEDTIRHHKETITRQEDTIRRHEETTIRQEDIIRRHEETITRQEDTIRHHKETITRQEDTIRRHEETTSRQEDTIHRQEETITRQEDTIRRHEETITRQEDTIRRHEETITRQEDTIRNHQVTNDRYRMTICRQNNRIHQLQVTNERLQNSCCARSFTCCFPRETDPEYRILPTNDNELADNISLQISRNSTTF